MSAAADLLHTLAQARGQVLSIQVAPLGTLRHEETRRREQFGCRFAELRSPLARLAATHAVLGEMERPAVPEEPTVDARIEDPDELTEPGPSRSQGTGELPSTPSAEDIEAVLVETWTDDTQSESQVGSTDTEILHEPPPIRPRPSISSFDPPSIRQEVIPDPDLEPSMDVPAVTLDDDSLLGVDDDELSSLEELSIEELEAEGMLDDESLDAELLGDEDSVDESELLASYSEDDSLLGPDAVAAADDEETLIADAGMLAELADENSSDREVRELEALIELDPGSVSVEPISVSVEAVSGDADRFDALEAALFEDAPGESLVADEASEESEAAASAELEIEADGSGALEDLRDTVLPTIRDRSAPRPIAAAAIQIQADGSAQMVSAAEESIEVEMPEADDDYGDTPMGGGFGINLVHDDDEYEDEEDDESEAQAPSLTAAPDANYADGSLELTGDDISQVEEIDAAYIGNLEARAAEALERGDLQAASASYTEILESDPANLGAHLGRGRCYMDLGDYAAAMSDFQRAEDLDPESPEALVAMGELFFARKEYTRAIEFFDQAIELDSGHAMARCRRGISYYYKKSYRQAFLDLQKAYTLDPEIPNIRKYVQMAIKKLERSGEA